MDSDALYVQVDFRAVSEAAPDERVLQRLFGSTNGSPHCQFDYIWTPPGGGSPRGTHTHDVDQIFYVISGSMFIEIENRTVEVGPGSAVRIPAGSAHRNWNESGTVHLSVMVPAPGGSAS